MGERSKPNAPVVIEVDHDNENKDIEKLDIELPVLSPRIYREYKNLEALNVDALPKPRLPLRMFSEDEQREIVFKDINRESVSHTTVLDSIFW
jgi:type III restriction enzyme